jgi:hypothetical protein
MFAGEWLNRRRLQVKRDSSRVLRLAADMPAVETGNLKHTRGFSRPANFDALDSLRAAHLVLIVSNS